jgi:hypothetical protein
MTTTGEQWGVWISHGRESYWWQGPTYAGDHIMTKKEATSEAARLQATCPQWSYEARAYVTPTK